MNEGLSSELWFVFLVTTAASALLAARDLPWLAAIGLAALRAAIPLAYFGWWYDPATSTTLIDDLVYVANARALLAHGYDPISVLVDPAGWDLLQSLSNGRHVAYAWWNLSAMTLLGDHYYSAVFCNVVATFAGGSLLARMLGRLGFPRSYCQGLLVFWLLHWDVIAWSSFLNLKDVLVQTLTIAGLSMLVGYFCERKARYLAGVALVSCLFFWLRFYVPILLGLAVLIWMLTQWSDWRKYLLIPPCAVACLGALALAPNVSDYFEPEAILYGVVRFTLTPIPWNIQEDYAFIEAPSVLHWVMFLPAVGGVALLWRDSTLARLCLIYGVCLTCMYAITEELLGPRQRFQLAFLFAWGQFHACWLVKQSLFAPAPRTTTALGAARPWPALSRNTRQALATD